MFGGFGFGQGYFGQGPIGLSRLLNICTTAVRSLTAAHFVKALTPLRIVGSLNPFRVVRRRCE